MGAVTSSPREHPQSYQSSLIDGVREATKGSTSTVRWLPEENNPLKSPVS